MAEERITLRLVSAVLVSPSPIETQSIRHETLVKANVVPASWIVSNQLSTPVIALTQYQNGFNVQAEGNRCSFQEQITDGQLQDDYHLHPLVERYIKATGLVPYNGIGINWLLEIGTANPPDWMASHLGVSNKFPEFAPATSQISKLIENGGACNLVFQANAAPRRIIADCNYHFPLSDAFGPEAALSRWRDCQDDLQMHVIPHLQ